MRIAFFTDTFFPNIDGVTTAVINYANGLAESGHEVLIVAPRYPKSRKIAGVNHHLSSKVQVELLPSVEMSEVRLSLPMRKMFQKVTAFDPDIIHTHTPLTIGLQGLYLARRLKKLAVTTHHTHYTDPEALKHIHMFESPVAHQFQKGLKVVLKSYYDSHDLVIVPTQDTKGDLRSFKVAQKIVVIPSPIASELFWKAQSAKQALRRRMGVKQQALIFVGRMGGEKNVDLVMRVFVELLHQFPQLQLVLIGDGPDKKKLFKLAEKLDINRAIIWTGAIPHKTLVEKGYYFLGDVFITLSRFETQGLSTIEAMACGLPVVGARAHATKEIIHGNGILISSKDPKIIAQKIAKLLLDKEKMKMYSEQSLKIAQGFSITASTEKLLAIYDKLLYNNNE